MPRTIRPTLTAVDALAAAAARAPQDTLDAWVRWGYRNGAPTEPAELRPFVGTVHPPRVLRALETLLADPRLVVARHAAVALVTARWTPDHVTRTAVLPRLVALAGPAPVLLATGPDAPDPLRIAGTLHASGEGRFKDFCRLRAQAWGGDWGAPWGIVWEEPRGREEWPTGLGALALQRERAIQDLVADAARPVTEDALLWAACFSDDAMLLSALLLHVGTNAAFWDGMRELFPCFVNEWGHTAEAWRTALAEVPSAAPLGGPILDACFGPTAASPQQHEPRASFGARAWGDDEEAPVDELADRDGVDLATDPLEIDRNGAWEPRTNLARHIREILGPQDPALIRTFPPTLPSVSPTLVSAPEEPIPADRLWAALTAPNPWYLLLRPLRVLRALASSRERLDILRRLVMETPDRAPWAWAASFESARRDPIIAEALRASTTPQVRLATGRDPRFGDPVQQLATLLREAPAAALHCLYAQAYGPVSPALPLEEAVALAGHGRHSVPDAALALLGDPLAEYKSRHREIGHLALYLPGIGAQYAATLTTYVTGIRRQLTDAGVMYSPMYSGSSAFAHGNLRRDDDARLSTLLRYALASGVVLDTPGDLAAALVLCPDLTRVAVRLPSTYDPAVVAAPVEGWDVTPLLVVEPPRTRHDIEPKPELIGECRRTRGY